MPFEVLKVPGSAALDELQRRRREFPQTGLYPFLIGSQSELNRLQEEEIDDESIQQSIELSYETSIEQWIDQRQRELAEDAEDDEELDTELPMGQWEGEDSRKGAISAHKDLITKQVYPEVLVGLARIESSWQLPAVLGLGGWNECPEAATHCAFHRQWQERYDAQIVSVTGDIIECQVGRPPRTPEQAQALAVEQYWYCSDIVEQGTGDIAALAATLLNSNYWYFWWD